MWGRSCTVDASEEGEGETGEEAVSQFNNAELFLYKRKSESKKMMRKMNQIAKSREQRDE